MGIELVARDQELVELLAAVQQRRGAVLRGESGMGKTALAQVVAHRLTAAGESVIWIVATAASQPVPFEALAPLLSDDLPALHPALVLGHVTRALKAASRGRHAPLVVIDDAHFLDDQSAATVLGLVIGGGARVLATVRSGTTPPDAVVALWKDGFLNAIDVGPFDRSGAKQLLVHGLGGEIAGATAELLWQRTRGNALYLCELIRYGRAEGRLSDVGGVWLWQGDLEVPPPLADLLHRRFEGLSEAGLDALAALVLGEPLAMDALEAVVPVTAIAEIEGRGLVEENARRGTVVLGFHHPLLAAAAERQLTSTRRRRIADALARAAGEHVDVVRRARWQLIGGGPPEVAVLIEGARRVLLQRPTLALRMAERALAHQPGVEAGLLVADARAELGEVDTTRQALATAAALATTDEEQLAVQLGQAAFTAWCERRPIETVDRLVLLRASLPERFGPDIDSAAALITAFAARPADAAALAEHVLAANPSRRAAIRAATALVGSLALLDRPQDGAIAAAELQALIATPPVAPDANGKALVMMSLAEWIRWDGPRLPLTDAATGRWPLPAAEDSVGRARGVATAGRSRSADGRPRGSGHQSAARSARPAARWSGRVPVRGDRAPRRRPRRRRTGSRGGRRPGPGATRRGGVVPGIGTMGPRGGGSGQRRRRGGRVRARGGRRRS